VVWFDLRFGLKWYVIWGCDLRFGIKIRIFLSKDLWFGTEIWFEICVLLLGTSTIKPGQWRHSFPDEHKTRWCILLTGFHLVVKNILWYFFTVVALFSDNWLTQLYLRYCRWMMCAYSLFYIFWCLCVPVILWNECAYCWTWRNIFCVADFLSQWNDC